LRKAKCKGIHEKGLHEKQIKELRLFIVSRTAPGQFDILRALPEVKMVLQRFQ
jgi:hypothetical protein